MKTIKSLCVIIMIALSFVKVSLAASADKIVAVVDDEIITNLEVEKMKGFMLAVGAINIDTYNMPETNKQVLGFQIERVLQLQLAKRFNILADSTDEQLKQYFLQSREYSEQDFISSLAKGNISEQYFLSKLKENEQIEKVQKNFIGSNVKLTDEMVYEFLADYHDDNTIYVIQDIHFNKDAKNFTASEYKELIKKALDSYSKNENLPSGISIHDLGHKSLSQLPDIYQDVAPNLKKGKPSHLIIAPNGMHSLLLVSKKEPESMPFESAKMRLYREKMVKGMTIWLDKLKQNAYIKLY